MTPGQSLAETKAGLPILAFVDRPAFERWLALQPADAAGAWIKIAKKGSAMHTCTTHTCTKAEAIDAALCHGWIDGQLAGYDEAHWLIRFTPRRARSKWSEINRARARQLIEDGAMQPAGLAQVKAAQDDGRWDAAYAPPSRAEVPSDLRQALDASPKAAAFFATLTSAKRYAVLYRVGAVKTPAARARKIATYVAMLERGDTLDG